MITLVDMKNAYLASLEKKGKRQARLRKDALELVRHYRESLDLPAEEAGKTVRTGMQTEPGHYLEKPIPEIEIDGYTLNFTITTYIDGNPVNGWFIVTVSIAMCEQDDMLSVTVEGASVPIIVIRDGMSACFSEVVEAIKLATLNKIDKTV
ncbi:hypothetical protein ACE1BH_20610 [Aeromonas jandaei]